ncbi:hypothetical protein ACFZBP_11390 [Streptomyces sp. NPDC008086]|uniref:hypothetical protein n=1 Tax=Streptomyces sp. NPDC008086 TaxID=3364807 RepID=UPI0036E635D7
MTGGDGTSSWPRAWCGRWARSLGRPSHTAVLRYEVGDRQDSSDEDFLRTYDVSAEPKRVGPAEVTYSDRFGGVRRTFTVTYVPSSEPGGYDYAQVTVRARGTGVS